MTDFDLEYSENRFFLTYQGNQVDFFELKKIAQLRLEDAKQIEKECEESGECPAETYRERFDTQTKFETFKKIDRKRAIKNERHNRRLAKRRGERVGRTKRNPLV